MDQRKAIILLGPPVSGKSTLANFISDVFGYKVIEAGKLIRKENKSNSYLGKRLKSFVEKGRLTPSDLVSQIIKSGVEAAGGSLLIFDGFPGKKQIKPLLKFTKIKV